VFLTGIEDLGVAVDFDQGAEMVVPILNADTGRQVPEPGGTLLNPVMATDLVAVVLVLGALGRIRLGQTFE
jgi:hypothetical protein